MSKDEFHTPLLEEDPKDRTVGYSHFKLQAPSQPHHLPQVQAVTGPPTQYRRMPLTYRGSVSCLIMLAALAVILVAGIVLLLWESVVIFAYYCGSQPSAPVTPSAQARGIQVSLSDASRDFGTAFYTLLANNAENANSNMFFSPLSILLAFSMTELGARGNTAIELSRALQLHQLANNADTPQGREAIQAAASYLLERTRQLGRRNVSLSTANALFVQQDFEILSEYENALKSAFDAEARLVDFKTSAETLETARSLINGYVSDHTNKMIPELLPNGVLNALSRLVLINTVYFKGTWTYKFDAQKTVKNGIFHLNAKDTAITPLMGRELKIPYMHNDEHGFALALLPYNLTGKGFDVIEMAILLPDSYDGLPALEAKISQDPGLMDGWFSGLSYAEPVKVDVQLPRFRMEQQVDLVSEFKKMGVIDLFSDTSADLSGVTGQRDLSVGAALHRAVVEVNEEGTEAAAATAVVMMLRSMPMRLEKPKFYCDHPFMFAIRARVDLDAPDEVVGDRANPSLNATPITYFLGRYVKPPN